MMIKFLDVKVKFSFWFAASQIANFEIILLMIQI